MKPGTGTKFDSEVTEEEDCCYKEVSLSLLAVLCI